MRSTTASALLTVSLAGLALLWLRGAYSESTSLPEGRKRLEQGWESLKERYEEWRERVKDRRKTLRLLQASENATLVAVSMYLDGGSIGYVFTNHLGSFTIFLQHPYARDDWNIEKAGLNLKDQPLFVGSENTGSDGLEVKVASRLDRKLRTLAESANVAEHDQQTKELLDKLAKALQTREFDWTDFPH